jgi:hypothetical protein
VNAVTRTDSVPNDSIILAAACRAPNYVDCFHVAVQGGEELSVDFLTAVTFSSMPNWALPLFALRNWLVVFVGLEPSHDPLVQELPRNIRFEPSERAIFFRVSHRTDDEIVMAEADRHLDFRVSIRKTPQADGASTVEVTTAVWFNNGLGRFYFAIMKPFHRWIVAAMVRVFAVRIAGGLHWASPPAQTARMPKPSARHVIAAWLCVLGGALTASMGIGHVFGARTVQQLPSLSALLPGVTDFIVLLFECVGILLLFLGGLSIYFARGLAVGDRVAKVFFACASLLWLGRVAIEVMHPVTVIVITPPVLVAILTNALPIWVALGLAVGGQTAHR